MFTIYRVLADYTQPKTDAIGPGWSCKTAADAHDLAERLKRRTDLCNIKVKACTYGY